MGEMDRQFESYVDFYKAEYASTIKRVTTLPFATLLGVEQTAGDWSDVPVPELVVAFNPTGKGTYSADIGAGRYNDRLDRKVTVLVAPDTATSFQMTGHHELQLATLPFSRLKTLVRDDLRLPEDGDFGALHSAPLANPLFGQMIGAMFDLTDPADPATGLFFESTLLAMVSMLTIEAGRPAPKPLHRGGLADWQVRRASEALRESHANFDLTTLANTVGLSPYHFSRAFKQSTGLPPHRYQIMLRIERAKDLLANTTLPICDVAAAIGYDDQGQLARLFRREVGVTPSQYRRERRR